MEKVKFAIAGTGFLGGIIARAWRDGYLPDYELVGIYGRNKEKTAALAAEVNCPVYDSPEALIDLKPAYIAEAASVALVRELALPALRAGISLVVLSIGAFADEAFYDNVRATAAESGAKVHIASGAVGGFDVLRTISLMGQAAAGIETRKGPASLKNTPLFKEELMADGDSTHVFSGNAAEAISLLPTKVNVAVATSLATIGPKNTSVNIHSVPGMVGDDHKIIAEIDGVKAVVDIYSSTSAIAGWSVVACLRNLTSPIMF